MVRTGILSAILLALIFVIWLTFQVPLSGETPSTRPMVNEAKADFKVTQIHLPGAGAQRVPRYEERRGKYKTHAVNGWFGDRRYHAYVGKSAAQDSARTAVFLLHGNSRTGVSMIDMWSRLADRHGLVLIAPDSAFGGWSRWTDSLSLLNRMVDDAAERYALDRNRLYLFGHSAGGIHATLIGQEASSPFRAVATHAGFPHASQISRSGAGGRVPVFYLLGDNDHILSVEGAMATGEALKQAGHKTVLMVVKDHTHWYYHIGPSLNERAWWFFEQN